MIGPPGPAAWTCMGSTKRAAAARAPAQPSNEDLCTNMKSPWCSLFPKSLSSSIENAGTTLAGSGNLLNKSYDLDRSGVAVPGVDDHRQPREEARQRVRGYSRVVLGEYS